MGMPPFIPGVGVGLLYSQQQSFPWKTAWVKADAQVLDDIGQEGPIMDLQLGTLIRYIRIGLPSSLSAGSPPIMSL